MSTEYRSFAQIQPIGMFSSVWYTSGHHMFNLDGSA